MCKHGTETIVKVKIPADLSCDGKEKWKDAQIDNYIAPLVKAIQDGGIDMRGSCCGHSDKHGWIELQDGRLLLIADQCSADKYWSSPTKFYLHSMWQSVRYAIRNHMNDVWRS